MHGTSSRKADRFEEPRLLLGGSGGAGQSSQIGITFLFGAIVGQFTGSWITVVPDFRVAICKIQSETEIVPMN